MDHSSPSSSARRPLLPWLTLAVVVTLAAGGAFWLNQKIDSVQAAAAPRQETGTNETQGARTGALQRAIAEIQADQQKLGEQVRQVQRAVAANQGERKLLSDQVGALSSRVDALASSNAEASPRQQSQGANRRR